ncbi:hypothetical protein [Nocardioides sp.]|uniref:hypothetical protein n=1 Tax=Nocardioides sp. TaxID=35761 RepID=UPI003518D8A9
MSHAPTRRRVGRPGPRASAVLSGLALVAAALVPLTTPAPALASPECLTEDPVSAGGILGAQTRCDDEVAPTTTLGAMTPVPNAAGFIRTTSISITFSGAHTDADTDGIGYECQLYRGTAPDTWTGCVSPFEARDLEQTAGTPYTFRVRAFDQNDRPQDATQAPNAGLFGSTGASADLPDVDQTPESLTFELDSVPPGVGLALLGVPLFDQQSPDFPMVLTNTLTPTVNSPDAATLTCRLNGVAFPCQDGQNPIGPLPPGDLTLDAQAVDAAGNESNRPRLQFSVPRNLRSGSGKGGWSMISNPAFFAGDLMVSTRKGATFNVKASKVKEMRVIAPSGKGFGVLEMRTGPRQPFLALDQVSDSTSVIGVVYQRYFNREFTGVITFRVRTASAKRPALLDAVLLH